MEELQAFTTAKESVEDSVLKQPGVTGIGVGYKYVAGKRTGQTAIQVFVKKKKKVPDDQMIPETIHGRPTDVIERTFQPHPVSARVMELRPTADTGTYNPVKGGISIGPCRAIGGFVYTGTLGAIVTDNATGDPLLLSNFHVMAIDTGWSVGDTMAQPSRVDTGTCPGSVVGTLLRAQLTASVDAAVCTLSGRGHACEIVGIGGVTGSAVATLGSAVRKRGRTTGLTYGTVDSVSLSVSLDYGDGIGSRILTNQIGIDPDTTQNPLFGDNGDSGSVVVDGSRHVIGLYFAGADDGYGVANPIAAVLSALNVSLCTAPVKSILKDFKDGKHEAKEWKREKFEIKERKWEKWEKLELKERKPEKFEVEGKSPISEIDPKLIRENDPFQPPIDPLLPPAGAASGGCGCVEGLSTFIGPELRPDLSTGALANEPDYVQTSRRLKKDAADALQAKTAFDNQTR